MKLNLSTMCETCGCGLSEGFTVRKSNGEIVPDNISENKHFHSHGHDHSHHHENDEAHHHHPDNGDHRIKLDLNKDILYGNDIRAAMNRSFLEGRRVFSVNLVSSPGSGKTTILEKTIRHFSGSKKVYVIEGDQQTMLDAERIEKAGAPAIQINTGSGCHLDAQMTQRALHELDPDPGSILFIENVGNLVCPALFDLGEKRRVLISSVTEGNDKPLKYPLMFEKSDLCILNKSDLSPYVDFSTEDFVKNSKSINPGIEIIILSAKTGEGLEKWYDWILKNI